MVEETSLEFPLRKVDETRNYLLDGIKWNKWNKLGKYTLNTVGVLISKSLINPYNSHDKFVSVNNVLRECNEMKKEIKNPETSVEYFI